MKLFKPLLTVLALAFALIFVTACSSGGNGGASSGKTTAKARTIDEIKKSGELRVAVFGDKKPFGYVDNDGLYQRLHEWGYSRLSDIEFSYGYLFPRYE